MEKSTRVELEGEFSLIFAGNDWGYYLGDEDLCVPILDNLEPEREEIVKRSHSMYDYGLVRITIEKLENQGLAHGKRNSKATRDG